MDHESLVYHHFQYLEWLFDYGWVHPCMIQPAKKDITMETPQILKKTLSDMITCTRVLNSRPPHCKDCCVSHQSHAIGTTAA